MCLLSNRISDYPFISQGKTRIPGVNDSSEGVVTDVRTCLHTLLTGSAHIATKLQLVVKPHWHTLGKARSLNCMT